MVRKFVDKYGIQVITSGGFDGLTVKKQMADRFEFDKPGLILHVGDYDPSGETMYKALEEDIQALGGEMTLRRIAVLPWQIEDLGLPTKPPKRRNNSHAAAFHDDITVELEAVPPSDLQDILEIAIENEMDMDAFQLTLDQSADIRDDLINKLDL